MPRFASGEAIKRSATGDSTKPELEPLDNMRLRVRFVQVVA